MPLLTPRLFRFLSRVFVAAYGRFPVLGELRSSVLVAQRGGEFLLQRRSDGLGWAFPGGTAWFWERAEQTLAREIREETGLEVGAAQLLFVYHDRHFVPSCVSVYSGAVTGRLRSSWEGEIAWMPLEAARGHFFPAQVPILEHLDSK